MKNIVIVLLAIGVLLFGCVAQSPSSNSPVTSVNGTQNSFTTNTSSQFASNSNTSQIQIVAAENFWGSLVQQLGGTHVNVLSVVSDPNADPHEYESNAADARAVANANMVIVNGVGYDDWALKLISASNNPNQTVLNVADLLGVPDGSNPIFGMTQLM